MKYIINILSILFLIIISCLISGCKKLIEGPPPKTFLTSENVYSDDATSAAVLTGLYAELSVSNPSLAATPNSIFLIAGLSADELALYGGSANQNKGLAQYYLNRLSSDLTLGTGVSVWNDLYAHLYVVNLALERLSASTNLTGAVKKQLIGEAKFLRGFFYFYLANLYGAVPLITSSDYRDNAFFPRTPALQVYQQIIADLKSEQDLLIDGYAGADAKSPTIERVRPNKWAAAALLARAYLYTGAYDSAELAATTVINNTALYDTTPLAKVFLNNSKEAIWQLQPVNKGWNTEDARILVLPSTGPTSNTASGNYPVYLNPGLISSFEPGDQRRLIWVDSVIVGADTFYYPYKYKSATLNAPVTEYMMVLRVSEQYLIRAEARVQKNNISGAQSDLNRIRTRAGLKGTSAHDRDGLLAAILEERRIEFFTEWGHRWLDIKRLGKADVIMPTAAMAKGTSWNLDWQWYPIPVYDIIQDPNIVQNPGY